MKSGAGAGDGFFDGLVDGELVGAGVDGKFQCLGKSVGFHGVREDGEVIVEFLFELRDVSDVVDTFVKATGELGSDGLNGNSLVGDGGENDEHLGRDLRVVGFVHGDFGNEVVGSAFGCDDVIVDGLGLLGGLEELVRGLLDELAGDLERGIDAFD